jgi:phthiocerol/phenolphthiocerol synthesis type-I polyketide synthase E
MMSNRNEELQGIAIVGMAGRFPGAKNVAEFWENIKNGVESITDLTEEELALIDEELLNDPNYVKRGAFLDAPEEFDAPFFDFIAREAEITDPQQRLFLEVAWEALEHSGYDSKQYDGRIGVFGGVGHNSYLNNLQSNPDVIEALGTYQTLIGNSNDFLSTRVAYKLDLKGTAVSVQTACSTSLVAVHLACQSLLTYESDMALAGGVSVKTPHRTGYLYQEGGIFSPDGHCRAFDASSAGTVVGNGVGLVALKRIEDAIEDGDTIYAVIRGSALNNDGSQKIGFTAPSVLRQSSVVSEALAIADVEPETVSYIETHGTGTTLGDPIEMSALTQAFRKGTDKTGYCAIGSVKSNIGHLDTAAGVTGLIKTVLALKHKQLPPSLHFVEPNPKIDFANSPFFVNSELTEWKTDGTPRHAGVSSFGIGGTNAHVVLEEAPELDATDESRAWQLLTLSAKSPTALDTATFNLADYLEHAEDVNLADVAYTLEVGRRAFQHRRVVVVNSHEDAVSTLRALDPKRVLSKTTELEERPIAFLFSGQGSQYPNMARDLYHTETVFQQHVDQCASVLTQHLGLDIRELIYPQAGQEEQARELLNQTQYTQPALFVIEFALAKLWASLDVAPQAMIGHSIGEYVAATLAGVLDVEDALALVAARGRMMQEMPRGSMLAVQLPEADVLPLLGTELSLAGVNGANSSVVAGPTAAIEALEQQLSAKGVLCRALETSHAFHSAMMDPILEAFTALVQHVKRNAPQIPYLSNVTGTWITPEQATDPTYYAKHLRQAVRFGEGVQELLKDESRILLEVGPGRSLSTVVRQNIEAGNNTAVVLSTVRHRDEPQPDVAFFLNAFGQLWLNGAAVSRVELHAGENRRRLPLPTYPFERKRYFVEMNKTASVPKRKKGKQTDLADWFRVPVWNRSVPAELLEQEEANESASYLLFLDDCEFGASLVKRLEQRGQNVVSVVAGKAFAAIGDGTYAINPQERANYSALFKALGDTARMPTKIVHLWSVVAEQEATGVDFYEQAQARGFLSLMFLAQALGEQNQTAKLPIFVVTNNLQEVVGETVLSPERATVFGAALVIPQEYYNLSVRSIDVHLPTSGSKREAKLADQLLVEFSLQGDDKYVAYRGQHRFVQAFEAARIGNAPENALRTGGVYLITGASTPAGQHLAEHLANGVQAKLVLVARPASDGVSQTIPYVEALQAGGTELIYFAADVADEAQMQGVIAQAEERFGDIHGVIHTEENMGHGLIQLKTREMVEQVFLPKVKGTLVLASLLQQKELDFFVLSSRMLSITGGFGQVDSVAANSFLDAFAHSRFALDGTFTTAIDWGLWKFDTYAAPENTLPEVEAQFKLLKEQYGITEGEFFDVFGHVISGGLPQVIVSAQQFEAVLDELHALSATASMPSGVKREFDENRPYVAPTNDVEQKLAELWQELFGVEQVSIHDNFFDLGGNSLLGVQLVSRIRSTFDIELPMSALFESASVAELSKVIADNQLGEEELDELERLLAEIEDLSDEEIEATLLKEE